MPFKRARTNEQVSERKKEIIIASAKLFDKDGFDGVNFKAISETTSFGRSTIYNYYKTKEEILLDLLLEEIIDWSIDLSEINLNNEILSKEEYCRLITDSYVKNIRMLKLMSILYSSLEKNSSLEKLTEFKKKLMNYMNPYISGIDKFFNNASKDDKRTFLINSVVFVSGLYPSTEMTEKQNQAIKNSGFEMIEVEFKDMCYKGLLSLASNL